MSRVLLHFERNANSFKKSLCRTDHQSHECGSGTSTNDCGGAHCLIGYMRRKQYLSSSSSTKKTAEISALFKGLTEPNNRQITYANAAWLRHIVPRDQLKPYTTNPFTNILISTDADHFTPLTQTAIVAPYEQKEITESIVKSKEVVVQIQHKGAKLIIG